MRTHFPMFVLAGILTAASFAQVSARPNTKQQPPVSRPPTPTVDVPLDKPATPARTIKYNDKDVVKLKTKLRYTTLIILPSHEEILDFACGDRDFWVVDGSHNFAYIKPAKQGARTNLNLITATGNIYSFMLSEVSEEVASEPDLKVFIEASEQSTLATTHSAARFVSIEQFDALKTQLADAAENTRRVQEKTQDDITKAKSTFIKNVRFSYRFEAGKKPFNVRAIYNDDKFTYIQARPEETPTLYEIRDKEPNLVEFSYRDGQYVVPKIIENGYLAIGKKRLPFKREE